MKEKYQQVLKSEVEKIYGKKITAYADCVRLTKDIAGKTGFQINVNTVRRFFGVIQATYPPSLTTLEIFSQYAGFRSFEHFVEAHHSQADTAHASNFFDYVAVLFERAASTTISDPTWMAIVRETILYLERNPHLVDTFQHIAARTEVGLTIYYEQFVHMDQLNGYYGNGLRYYLASRQTKEAQIFGHALLALRYFLAENGEALEVHYQKLMQHSLDNHIHPFVSGRYFATQLLYHHGNPEKAYRIAVEARRFYGDLPLFRDAWQGFPCFELVIAEALALTGQWLELLFYTGEAKKKKTDYIPPTVDIHLFTALELYEAMAYAALGEEERAKKALKRLRPADFYFLSRQYHTILYTKTEANILGQKQRPGGHDAEKEIRKLGFTALLKPLGQNTLDKKEQF